MTQEDKPKVQAPGLFTADGKPLRVLSTSLGIALLANAVFSTGAAASGSNAQASDVPKLVSWSSEEVKAYYNANVDWSLPIPDFDAPAEKEDQVEKEGGGEGSGGRTVVHHYGSGFGWDDLLLYHLLFNSGSSYSSGRYYNTRPAYHTNTGSAYKPKTYSSGTFQNKPVAGSTVRPKTSSSTGSVTRRSTSSQPGGIGGNSSGLSSSGGSSSVSKSSGFGG